MPKKAKSGTRVTKVVADELMPGYYVYSDGSSEWGCGMIKKGETPLRITDDNAKEIHVSSVEDKKAWHKAKREEIAEALKAKK